MYLTCSGPIFIDSSLKKIGFKHASHVRVVNINNLFVGHPQAEVVEGVLDASVKTCRYLMFLK